MTMMVSILLIVAELYLIAGILFAILSLSKGIKKVDAAAHGSGWGFRLVILPGIIVLWPVLLIKWIKAKK